MGRLVAGLVIGTLAQPVAAQVGENPASDACRAPATVRSPDAAVAAMEHCYLDGRLEEALAAGSEVLARLETAGREDEAALARLLTEWGRVSATRAFLRNAPTDSAEAALRRALALAAPGTAERTDALIELGFAEYVRSFLGGGAYEGVEGRFDEAERIARALGDTLRLSRAVFHRGLVEERTGRRDAALEHYRSALLLAQACGCRMEESYAQRHVAFMLAAAGDHAGALKRFRTSLELRRQVGFRTYLPFSLITVADELLALGRPAEAEPYASEARELAAELGIPRVRVLALLTSGEVALARKEPDRAAEHFRAAVTLAKGIGYGAGVRAAEDGLARAAGHPGGGPRP
jgi:tetratricopeptide (TPR) repeat protein